MVVSLLHIHTSIFLSPLPIWTRGSWDNLSQNQTGHTCFKVCLCVCVSLVSHVSTVCASMFICHLCACNAYVHTLSVPSIKPESIGLTLPSHQDSRQTAEVKDQTSESKAEPRHLMSEVHHRRTFTQPSAREEEEVVTGSQRPNRGREGYSKKGQRDRRSPGSGLGWV